MVVGGALVATPVKADPASPEDKALAEGLFREARSLVESGQVDRACAKFSESHRLEPKLGTLLHLATCHEQTGRLASAWAEYQEAASLAARSREPERQRIASERASAIEPKLARVRIVLATAIDGLELTLDGRPLGAASINVPLPVDPGAHVFEARAPGRKPWRAELVPAAATITDVNMPALEPLEVATPTPAPTPAPAAPESSPPSVTPTTLVLGGLGIVGAAVGGVFGVRFFAQRSEGLAECERGTCTAHGLEQLDAARSSSLVSGIGFGVGVAALTGAVIVHASGIGREPRATVALGPNGVRIGGRW